jgi:hypothetical protein
MPEILRRLSYLSADSSLRGDASLKSLQEVQNIALEAKYRRYQRLQQKLSHANQDRQSFKKIEQDIKNLLKDNKLKKLISARTNQLTDQSLPSELIDVKKLSVRLLRNEDKSVSVYVTNMQQSTESKNYKFIVTFEAHNKRELVEAELPAGQTRIFNFKDLPGRDVVKIYDAVTTEKVFEQEVCEVRESLLVISPVKTKLPLYHNPSLPPEKLNDRIATFTVSNLGKNKEKAAVEVSYMLDGELRKEIFPINLQTGDGKTISVITDGPKIVVFIPEVLMQIKDVPVNYEVGTDLETYEMLLYLAKLAK